MGPFCSQRGRLYQPRNPGCWNLPRSHQKPRGLICVSGPHGGWFLGGPGVFQRPPRHQCHGFLLVGRSLSPEQTPLLSAGAPPSSCGSDLPDLWFSRDWRWAPALFHLLPGPPLLASSGYHLCRLSAGVPLRPFSGLCGLYFLLSSPPIPETPESNVCAQSPTENQAPVPGHRVHSWSGFSAECLGSALI